jgi:hypothetical protein
LFIAEQKCFFGFRKGKLTSISEAEIFLNEFAKWSSTKSKSTVAWECFVNFNVEKYRVKIKKDGKRIDGKILIWASYEANGIATLLRKYEIDRVISIQDVINDLITWRDHRYFEFIAERENWIKELFENLR